jgi:Sulfotransferase family
LATTRRARAAPFVAAGIERRHPRRPEDELMAQHQSFVIVSLPRTGSTYLVDYLDAIDGVRCLSEVFHPNEIMLRHHRTSDPGLLDIGVRDSDPLAYLQRLEQDVGDCRWFGFKHFPRHGAKLLQHLCANPQWRKIFLWRDNVLEQYLSFLLASAHFGQVTWGRVPDEARVTVPPNVLLDDFHTIERNYIMIEEALMLADPAHLFALEYHDLGRVEVMRRLLHFLGLPEASIDQAVAQTAGKMGAGELKFERGPNAARRIANYDEIRRLLLHTRYRRLVENTAAPAFA